MAVTAYTAACSVLWFLRTALLLIPVYLVVALIAVDWYVFVVKWAFGQPHDSMPAITLLVMIFSFVVFMILWSYGRTILTSSAVSDNPPPSDYFDRVNALFPGQPERTCVKCQGAPKPLRSHHCSICGKCILKMDHHCPWVATCVGFKNYKYFCLFVMWGCLGCFMYLIAGLQMVSGMFSGDFDKSAGDSFASLLSSLLTAAFAISLFFFSAFHIHLVLTGQSTIEASLSRKRKREAAAAAASAANGPDLESQRVEPISFSAGSKRANWEAVFGPNPWLWFFPLDTLEETGYEFDFLFEPTEEETVRDRRDSREEREQLMDGADRDSNGSSPNGGSRTARARGMEMELEQQQKFLAHQASLRQYSPRGPQEDDSAATNDAEIEDVSMSAIVRELQ